MLAINIPNGAVQLTGNEIKIEVSGAAAPAGSEEYQVTLKITSTDGKLKGSPFTMAKTPLADGTIDFDISGYVDQPVTAVFQFPATNAVLTYEDQAFNVTVQVGERYIDSSGDLQQPWGASEAMQLLKGGLSPRQVNYLNDLSSTFYSKYLVQGRWLTARPQGYIRPEQPVKMWYMPLADAAGAEFKMKVTYDDGSETTKIKTVNLLADALHEFNANPYFHGVNLEPTGKKAKYLSIWIEGISQNWGFAYDWNYCERPNYLFFANTFGGVDDVYFTGRTEDLFTTEGEIVSRKQQSSDTVFTPTLLQLNKTGQNKWRINTGWKPFTEIVYYRDLLIAKQAWYIYKTTGGSELVIPITDIKGSELLVNRDENLFSMDIEFYEAHKSQHTFDTRIF